MSNNPTINELDRAPHAVWCKLNSQIDPTQWANLCRMLGQMPADSFEQIYTQTLSRKKIKSFVQKLVHAITSYDATEDPQVPVTSIGPSGIGGDFQNELNLAQHEIQMKHRDISHLRQNQAHFNRTAIDLRA